jgi:hypothetical protein
MWTVLAVEWEEGPCGQRWLWRAYVVPSFTSTRLPSELELRGRWSHSQGKIWRQPLGLSTGLRVLGRSGGGEMAR